MIILYMINISTILKIPSQILRQFQKTKKGNDWKITDIETWWSNSQNLESENQTLNNKIKELENDVDVYGNIRNPYQIDAS